MKYITLNNSTDYAIFKELIDAYNNNHRLFNTLITQIMPTPIESPSSNIYILSGMKNDAGFATPGFAIVNGDIVLSYLGVWTNFYEYIETPTIVEGVDESGIAYRTEIIEKKLVPSGTGISVDDMVRVEIAIQQQFKSNPTISTGLDSRFVIGASNCHITQFNRAQFDVDYNEHIVNSNPIIIGAGWNNVHTIPVAYRTTADIDVTGIATMTHGSVVKLVPVRIVAGVVQFYEEDGFVTSDFLLNVRLNYAL